MKKVFLFLTMLLFAFTGTMRAESLTVHEGTTTNGNVPVYGFYADAYNKCEMVYPAAELSAMAGGTINSLTFYASQTSVNWGANFQVFVAEVADATISAFAGPGTVVYEGQLSIADGEMVVTFDTPYAYAGGNLLVGVYETSTGSYITSYWYGESVTGASGSGYNYNSLADCSFGQKNFLPKVTFDYTVGGGAQTAFSTTPSVLDLGYRPNGAWMAPYVFNMKSNVGAVTVNYLDFSGNYFTYNAELPATVSGNNPLEVAVNHGEAEPGEVNSTITVLYSGNNRDAEQLEITAHAYNPAEGDVFEQAIAVPALAAQTPYTTQFPEGMYKNYELPVATEANDAVYQLTFNQDVLLYAGAEDGNVVLYTEDFNGEDGPMADNQYVYNGPQINPGPTNIWFSYDYTGSNTWYGTSAGGGFYFGYKLSTDVIAANGLAGLTITQVEAAAREAYPYYCYIIEGGATPFDGDLIGMGGIENPEALYFFDINLEEPAYISGNDDIWVIFYSDSPYAAYCGRYPVSTANGKIWTYNPNASSPMWSSNTTYTPVIYARMLELPTGREVTMNLADMSMPKGNGVSSEIAAIDGEVMNTPKAQLAQNNRGNRETQTLLEQGFEDGMGDWTMNNCHSSTGVSTGYTANTGSAVFRFYYTTNYPQYLISPVLEDNNGGNMSFYYASYSSSYAETFKVGYSTTTNDPSAFTWGSQVTATNLYSSEYLQYSYDFPAGTKYVAIACTSNDQFYLFVDDIVVTADITSGGGGGGGEPTPYVPYVPTFTAEIDGMYVPAGTYYLVAAADEQAAVNIAINTVPAPEQAVIVAPYDGETNVGTPYLAEWVLGDYTTEMQVLVGTQYPPQTALIDWTDYLVESAFIMDLEPNQSYFMQVNERNAAGTTMGEVIAFTTPIDGVTGFAVENDELYPGDVAVFTWDANRTFKGYNLYMSDGNGIVKVNESLITTNTYPVEDLEYNMDGYQFAVTAVYDAGESDYSDVVTVYMTGNGTVSGHAYDKPDEDTDAQPIAFALVEFRGTDEYGEEQSFVLTADEEGAFTGEILAGNYVAAVITDGYDNTEYVENIVVNYNELTDNIDIYTHEFYYPLEQITATEQEDNTVLVEWSWTPGELIVDFETGDFSQANFTLPATYPWTVTTTNPHEGTYCMKSTCEGIASGTSEIEVTVDVPFDGKMGFWVRVSSEANYDKFHFFIDGVEKGAAISGQQAYAYKEFDVTEGTHTYKWQYAKDSSVNSNDDCAYVDDVTLYRYEAPLPPVVGATTYDFDDNTMMGWTSIDADGDGNGWVSSSNPGIYHNSGVNLSGTGNNSSEAYVISGSYANQTGAALTPDNYLVSPAQISAEAGAQIQFWACAQDASYAAEHFGVAVSTTTATAAAFTTIQEWTMTAKNAGEVDANSEVRGTRQGTWYNYAVDLSAYAGQDIWVAIRHFNCTDMFILNVDDITLATGGTTMAPRGDRSLANYNLYRRNNYNNEEVIVAENIASDVMEYTDAAWANLPFGEYQWGIQAKYEGYAPVDRSRETATFGFENGSLEGWTNIVVNTDGGEWLNSDDNLGGYDYTELAHTGTGFAMCYSYVDYVGAYDTDAYLVSPQKYAVDANSTISFWADNANDDYPENFSVCVSTAATPTAASFTQVWSGGAKGTGNGGAAVRRAENRYENWRSHEISLAAYAGQEIWIAFHDVNEDMYEIWIDDVTITYAGSAPGPQPTPGDGLSEILWSNVIEKDMNATLTFNVTTNNGQAPVGATIAIEGENNYTVTIDETGVATQVVRKGEYTMEATFAGYTTTWSFDGAIEADASYDIEFIEIVAPVDGLYVSPTGWAMWEGGSQPTPGPGPQPGPGGVLFEDDFEDGALGNWTTVDADGDGDTWQNATPDAYGIGAAHSGTNCASSWSWNSYSMDPDNWMISPMVDGAASITYYVATNTSYPDHYGVYASSTGTATSDFTKVFEETAGSKGVAGVKASTTNGGSRDMSAWNEKTVNLPAGTKYVAFRHWDSYDMNYLFIDDVTISGGSKDRAALYYVVKLDGVLEGQTTEPYYQHNVEGLEEGSTHITKVRPVYATGNGDWMEFEWVYTACDGFASATGLAAAAQGNDVKLTWTMPGGGNPGPNPQPGQDETFNFDDGTFMGWTTIDANNDGYNWVMGSQIGGVYLASGASLAGSGHNSSADLVCSGSYSNATASAITPDNYLVAPTQAGYSSVSFFACAQDASYAAEHYGVAVSTTGNTSAADFTMVAEWTMTAKEAGAMSVGRDGQTRAQGAWYEKTVDLSAYAGQNIWIAIRHFNCNDQFILNVDDITLHGSAKAERDMWDLVGSFTGTSAGQQAVATDGNYIYTASWQSAPTGGHTFYQYTMDGTFVEGFEIAGATGIRDLTTDGEYFYGTSGGAQIFILDFTTRTLVGTINCSGLTSRHISYDPERDGFWSGNWSTLALYSRTGALIQNGPAPTSAYGSAYYKDSDNVEHLFLFCQPNSDCKVYDYNITTGTLGSSVVLDYSNVAPGCTGIAGGCFIGEYNGNTCWYGNAQQDPNLIAIFELEAGTPGPQPVEGILGAEIFRDGEPIAFVEGGNASQYIVVGAANEEATYGVRVVYDGEQVYPDATYYAMSCMAEVEYTPGQVVCDPVTNLTATQVDYQGAAAIQAEWDAMTGATGYKVYLEGEELGQISGHGVTIHNSGTPLPEGTYTVGVVAVYASCESEMAETTVTITYEGIEENEVVNAIYPNPTSGDLHINATAMTHVTVFNAMGQMVYNQDVNGDEMIINMGQYEAGVYMVRIDTENGSSVKRITVVK